MNNPAASLSDRRFVRPPWWSSAPWTSGRRGRFIGTSPTTASRPSPACRRGRRAKWTRSISTVRLFYEYYQPSKLRAIFHDIVKEECFTLRKEDTITDKVFEKCRLKRLSAFMALLMLGEWPLMVFTGFTMNINGLRGFSQSCTPSHSHLLHTQFSMCLGTRSVGSTAIKHPMQRCYKYQHITFIQPLYPLVEMPIHVVIEWEPVAMWRTEKGSTFNTH